MDNYNFLDDIINHIEPRYVPTDYILLAKVIDISGHEQTLYGKEITNLFKNKNKFVEAKVIVDAMKLKNAILDEIDNFYDNLFASLKNKNLL